MHGTGPEIPRHRLGAGAGRQPLPWASSPAPADCGLRGPAGERRPIRILYIEDNRLNVAVLAGLFAQGEGFDFESAPDGPSGLEAVRRCRPDVVLLDINLPGMTGDEVLPRLRAIPGCERIPCIGISANTLAEEIQRYRAIGFSAYLTKPFDLQRLLALVIDMAGPPAARD